MGNPHKFSDKIAKKNTMQFFFYLKKVCISFLLIYDYKNVIKNARLLFTKNIFAIMSLFNHKGETNNHINLGKLKFMFF